MRSWLSLSRGSAALGAAVVTLALTCPQAQAGFILVDDFSHPDFTVGSSVDGTNGWSVHRNADFALIAEDPTDPGNQVMHVRGSTAGWPASLTMTSKSLGDTVAVGDEATVFVRVLAQGDNFGAFGFLRQGTSNPTSAGYNSFSAAVEINNLDVRVLDGSSTVPTTTEIDDLTWHNVWIVVDNGANTFRVYTNTGTDDATEADRVGYFDNGDFITTFDFRDGTTDVLDRFMAVGHINARDLFYDSIYFSQEANLAFIPEPGSAALLGLGALLVLRRRRAA